MTQGPRFPRFEDVDSLPAAALLQLKRQCNSLDRNLLIVSRAFASRRADLVDRRGATKCVTRGKPETKNIEGFWGVDNDKY